MLHTATPAAPPSSATVSIETHDVDDQAGGLAGWQQRYQQLSPGKFDGCIDMLALDGMQVFFETTNQRLHQTGAPPGDRAVLALPLEVQGEGWCAGRALQRDSVIALTPSSDFSLRTPLAMAVGAIVIDSLLLAETAIGFNAQALLSSLFLAGTAQLIPGGPVEALRSGLLNLRGAMRSGQNWLHSANAQRTIMSALLCQWLATLSTLQPDALKMPQSRQQRRKVAVQAQRYIHEHLVDTPTVLDVSRHVNVHERVLQYCFQEAFAVSPTAFIKNLRLHEVRRELRADVNCEKSIGDVAARWGFWHPSRFAQEYRQLFGEKPSETHRCSMGM